MMEVLKGLIGLGLGLPLEITRRVLNRLLIASGLTYEDLMFPRVEVEDGRGKASVVFMIWRFAWALVQYWGRMFRLLFAPEILLRRVLAIIVLQTMYEVGGFGWKRLRNLLWSHTGRGKQVGALHRTMKKSTSYAEWREAYYKLSDLLDEPTLSKEEKNICARLQSKVQRYNTLLKEGNIDMLQFHLRGDLLRKHFGINHKSNAVRAALHEYVECVCTALNEVATTRPACAYAPDGGNDVACVEEELVSMKQKLTFFQETRHSFGSSALMLSGGARMGLLHIGVIKTLMEQKLLPRVISGSSAGALIAAMLGCKTDDEVREILFDPERLNLRFFGRSDSIGIELDRLLQNDTPEAGTSDSTVSTSSNGSTRGGTPGNVMKKVFRSDLFNASFYLLPPVVQEWTVFIAKLVPRWMSEKALLDVNVLKEAVHMVTGDMTFQEAYHRTGRIINITVTPQAQSQDGRDFPQLLNYLTTPHVVIWSAAVASCSIPGVFAPVELVRKNMDGTLSPYSPEGMKWTDGSIECDLPVQRLKELFNVNHFIVSQVNVHARILAPHQEIDFSLFMTPTLAVPTQRMWDFLGRIIMFLRDDVRSFAKHFANFGLKSRSLQFISLGLLPIFTQKYHGDITIVPEFTLKDVLTLLKNPTDDEYRDAILAGERNTWPKLSDIRRRCMTEYMLDDCVKAMEHQVKVLEAQIIKRGKIYASSLSLARDFARAQEADEKEHTPSKLQEKHKIFDRLSTSSTGDGKHGGRETDNSGERMQSSELSRLQQQLIDRTKSVVSLELLQKKFKD